MRIAIPTYKRSKTIREKTLKYLLDDCKVDVSIIDVFVADEEELKDYGYLKEAGLNIVVGLPTLKAQRNFITNYYEEGQKIINIDDDVTGIYKRLNDKTTGLFTEVIKMAEIGFNECLKSKTKLFGIGAVLNPFFMNAEISTNLKYIVGCFWGQIIDHSPELTITLEDKEDYERTIKYFDKFKKVVRLNMFAPKTAYYGEDGGMQVTRTEQRVTASAYFLSRKYPQYCSINGGKKNSKWTEIKLNSRAT